MTEAEQIMKRCQAGTRNYEEANNLHAACYGIIGKLLSQPDQEPVAWRTFDGEGQYEYRTYEENENYANNWSKRNPNHKGWVDKLYTYPPQRIELQIKTTDPFESARIGDYNSGWNDCLFASGIVKQTERTWVGLTDDDTFEIGERLGLADVAWIDLMKAIEAKLKERNT